MEPQKTVSAVEDKSKVPIEAKRTETEKEEVEPIDFEIKEGETGRWGSISKKGRRESKKIKRHKLQIQEEPISYYKLFKYATGNERLLVFTGIIFGILCGAFLPVMIVVYGEFTTLLVDRSTPNKTISPTVILKLFHGGRETDGNPENIKKAILDDAAAFGIEYCILGLLQFVVSFVTVCSLNYASVLQTARLRRLFLKAVLRQEISWFDCTNANSFPSKMIEDLDRVQEGIGEKIGIFLNLVMGFAFSVVMAFFYGWKLTLVMLTCAPILIASNSVVSKVQSGLTAKEMKAYGRAGSVAEEVISVIKTVMAFNGEKKELKRYERELEFSEKTGIRRGLLSGLGSGILWFITYSCYALAFWYGVSLILESRENNNFEYTPAVLIITFFGVLAGAINLGQSTPYMESFAVARGAGASVFQLLERKSKIDPMSRVGATIPKVKGEIQFKDVHFEYPARPEVKVLKGINIRIKGGETVALVGYSGCGKSTIVQLLQRLYDPTMGSITLDGEPFTSLNVKWLRKQFGVVEQEPSLFSTTIYQNISFGTELASKEDVEKAAKQANAHDFIVRLPEGYQTVLGAKGSQISGGQKQRIAIARALIRNPKILLMDEATSALDSMSEKKVQEALDRAAQGRTTIIVTHKLSAIAKADRIIVLSEGQVVEEGNHEELIALKGQYFKLVEMEMKNEKGKGKDVGKSVGVDLRMSTISSTKEFDDLEKVEEEKLKPAPFIKILKLNKPEWWAIILGALGTIVVGGSTPALAILFGELYGVLSDTDAEKVTTTTALYSIMLLVLGLITGVASFLQLYLLNYSGVKLTSRLRKLVFAAILRQEAGWFDDEKQRVGILCARLSTSAADIQGATGARFGVVFQASSIILIGVSVGFFYSWKMTLITLIAAPIIFFGLYFESKIIEGQSVIKKQSIEGATKVSVEAIANIRTVARLGREDTFLDRYNKELLRGEIGMKLRSNVRGVVYGIGTAAPYLSYALTLWYGGVLVANKEIHYKDVIKVSEALLFGMWILGQTLAFAPNFSQAKISAARLFQILERKPKLCDGDLDLNEGWQANGKVNYSGVEFSYPTRPDSKILNGFNLEIEKGQSIALVGPSGCGKSTVIQLLLRFYEPSKGSIRVDDFNISSLKIPTLRNQLGIVSQEPILFDKTIAENIAYGDNSREVPESEIIEAAKRANIHEFITLLPLGYETKVGASGTQLSGGQKQRIAIARALVRNPKILLLDEATSALDPESEAVVQTALDGAASGRTTITVSHRVGAIRKADVIYKLDRGRVKEAIKQEEVKTKKSTTGK